MRSIAVRAMPASRCTSLLLRPASTAARTTSGVTLIAAAVSLTVLTPLAYAKSRLGTQMASRAAVAGELPGPVQPGNCAQQGRADAAARRGVPVTVSGGPCLSGWGSRLPASSLAATVSLLPIRSPVVCCLTVDLALDLALRSRLTSVSEPASGYLPGLIGKGPPPLDLGRVVDTPGLAGELGAPL